MGAGEGGESISSLAKASVDAGEGGRGSILAKGNVGAGDGHRGSIFAAATVSEGDGDLWIAFCG